MPEFVPVARPVNVGKDVLEDAGFRGRPPQRHHLSIRRFEHRAMACYPGRHLFHAAAFDRDDLPFRAGVLHFALIQVLAGAQIYFLDVQILHVEAEIGLGPRDAVVMPRK